MRNGFIVKTLRVLLVMALLVIVVVQALYLPWLSGELAQDLPDAAYMRWPILTLAILGLLCVQAGIVCTLRLLAFVHHDRVFSRVAVHWVDGIIAAFLGGSGVCIATIVYQSFAIGGPPIWMLTLLAGTLAGIGLALLMTVMRALLMRATTLKDEMDVVI